TRYFPHRSFTARLTRFGSVLEPSLGGSRITAGPRIRSSSDFHHSGTIAVVSHCQPKSTPSQTSASSGIRSLVAASCQTFSGIAADSDREGLLAVNRAQCVAVI